MTHGALEFRDVGFHYPGAEHPVLTGISFATAPGQTTAIVGSTGAGKTTLVNLILRLFDSTEGTVLVGGVDVHDLDPDVLWSTIGLVPQRPYLFSGTVASNLQFGKPDATEDEMWAALEVAQATDFVRAMPGGLRRRIEQGGTNVSGGQRQRLSIARALIRKPDIYVFDDSFSALDLATDARLRAALGPYTKDAAVVIVAQRVSTISTADNILVLEDGVVDRPRHARGAAPRHARRTPRSCSRRSARRARHDARRRAHARAGRGARPLRARRSRAAGRWNSAGVPGERSKDFKNAVRRLGGMLGPMWVVLVVVAVVAVASATLNVFGPRVLGHGTEHHRRGRAIQHQGIDFGALHHVLFQALGAVRRLVGPVARRGVHARRRHPAV